MASMYAQYIEERTNDFVLENDIGFATYRYLEDGISVYIIDIFMLPAYRKDRMASKLADEIVEKAKKHGCTQLLGSVVPSAKNSTTSMQVLIGYGMRLHSSSNDFIVFKKEI